MATVERLAPVRAAGREGRAALCGRRDASRVHGDTRGGPCGPPGFSRSHLSQWPCPPEPAAHHPPAIAVQPGMLTASSAFIVMLVYSADVRGALSKQQALCCMRATEGTKGSLPLPSQSSGWAAAASPSRACLKFQALNTSARHPAGLPPPQVPTAPHMGLAWNSVTTAPILHQAGGSGAQGE